MDLSDLFDSFITFAFILHLSFNPFDSTASHSCFNIVNLKTSHQQTSINLQSFVFLQLEYCTRLHLGLNWIHLQVELKKMDSKYFWKYHQYRCFGVADIIMVNFDIIITKALIRTYDPIRYSLVTLSVLIYSTNFIIPDCTCCFWVRIWDCHPSCSLSGSSHFDFVFHSDHPLSDHFPEIPSIYSLAIQNSLLCCGTLSPAFVIGFYHRAPQLNFFILNLLYLLGQQTLA